MVVTLNERLLNMEKALQIEYENEGEEETDAKHENDADKVMLVTGAKGDGLTDQNGLTHSVSRKSDKREHGEINHNDDEEDDTEEDVDHPAMTNSKGGKQTSAKRSRKRSRVK